MADNSSLPPLSPSLAMLVNRLRGQPQSFQGYAQTRLGRTPIIYAQSPEQFEELDNPLHNPLRHDYGATFMSRSDLGPANISTLHDPVAALLSQGQPVSVIRPPEAPVAGPGGSPGTEPGVPLHEATHAYTKGLPLQSLYQQLPDPLRAKMTQAIVQAGYSPDAIPGEVASRLVAGQFGSLGLTQEEGLAARQQYLANMQKVAPQQGTRLQMYTRGRQPVTALDQYGVNRPVQSPQE